MVSYYQDNEKLEIETGDNGDNGCDGDEDCNTNNGGAKKSKKPMFINDDE